MPDPNDIDIVMRLLTAADIAAADHPVTSDLLREAAATIETLRAELDDQDDEQAPYIPEPSGNAS